MSTFGAIMSKRRNSKVTVRIMVFKRLRLKGEELFV